MMKFYVLPLSFCITHIVAQPILSSAVIGSIGAELSNDIAPMDVFDPGPEGADVIWDFSDFPSTGSSIDFTFIAPSSTAYDYAFLDANIATDDGAGNYGYFNVTATSYAQNGFANASAIVHYDDPEILCVFPLTYGTTNTDDFHSEFYSGVDFERSGSNTMYADGYGTLILPTGTYTEVVRVKVVQYFSDEAIGIPYTIYYDNTLYYWYKEGITGALFEYFYQSLSGSVSSTNISALLQTNIITDIEANNTNSNFLTITPNPAHDFIHLQHSQGIEVEILFTLYDITGKIVLQETFAAGNTQEVNISSLPAGVYIAEVMANAERRMQKIILE
jgi:hypothetical protein